jgi:imidazolonepropionase-like amidohydrolase
LVDAASNRTAPLQRVIVRGDRIHAVTSPDAPLPDTVDERISAEGAFASPGLVDHHVHLVPGQAGTLERVARGGVTMVNAMAGDARVAGEYARQVIARELAGPEIAYAMRAAGTVLQPRLTVFVDRDAPALMANWSRLLTQRAHAAGVPIVAGTDQLAPRETSALPSIHDELAHLVQVGLSTAAALASSTAVPARVMGHATTHGVLAPGYVADLVLLGADPLADITATRSIRQVVLRGRVLATDSGAR